MIISDRINDRRITRDWRVLCEDIGERRAGTPGETRAGEYIARQFTQAGLSGVHLEEFPCTSLRSSRTMVQAHEGRRWRTVPSNTLVGAPGTPGGKPVEGELVWLEMPENIGRFGRGSLRGKIAVIFGPLAAHVDQHRRLMAAAPAAVIQVDDRLPFDWCKSDGVYPVWARLHGMPVTVTVPYMTAWCWKQKGVRRARVGVKLRQISAISHNVVGELPGTDPRAAEIVISGHHDTQCGNPGADDNASGVMSVLELARVLAGRSRRRTIRFISFGTEEQLSVGSAAYVRAHRVAVRRVGLVVNFDSVASPLGHFQMWCAGPKTLAGTAAAALAKRGVDVVVKPEVTPFVDNFAFNWAGVPSLWFFRPNFPGGRWQHHSQHDTLANVSVTVLGQLLRAVAPYVAQLAAAPRWPFPRSLPPVQQQEARRLGRELFDLR